MDAAMNSAVSALQAQSSALSTVSDNLANSQTTGYKAVDTQFVSLLTQQAQGLAFPSGGVLAVTRQNLQNQGLISNTSTSTDMALNGNGLFPVNYGVGGNQYFFTRNGAFDTDSKGNLVLSGTNYYLMGWPTDTKGKIQAANPDNVASLQNVNVSKYNSSAVATTSYSLQANLPAEAQNDLANFTYTNASGMNENVTMGYSLMGTTPTTAAADSTATYLVTVNAPVGQTISDGTTTTPNPVSQLVYEVTVDTNAGNNGTILNIQGATPGATAQYQNGNPVNAPGNPAAAATFPSITPSDSVGGATAITYPSSWTAGTPTWGQVSSTLANTFTQSTSMAVYDSLGVQQNFPVTWTASGTNTWIMTVGSPTNPSGSTSTGSLVDSAGNVVNSYSYEVSFNTDGSLGKITPLATPAGGSAPTDITGLPTLSASWSDGAAASTGTSAISVNLGTNGKTDGLSQFDTGQSTPLIAVKSTLQNGVQYGQLTGVSVDESGNVIAAYDNGQKVPIFKIPVVTFPNENGLMAKNDGVYEATGLSGNYTLNQAGINGAGTITGSALEGSNVNTSFEFSNMITAQQAYSSASQVIGVDKRMFESLIQVIQ
jgi:flagellar hook protein FlgE